MTRHFGVEARDIAFVSSNRWDVMGAASFGFQALWINRARLPDEYPEGAPLRELSALMALPDLNR